MQPQQQTVVTSAVPVQPVYISQPYQTASVVNSYRRRQSIVIGILLIVAGGLSIIFNIVDLAIGTKDEYTSYSYYSYDYEHTLSHKSNGVAGHGFWCGVLVSILVFQITIVVFTARCYASAVYAMTVCLSVCLSGCPSICPCHKSEFYHKMLSYRRGTARRAMSC